MMKFADLERAHLTLTFIERFPSATDVRITYLRASEKITVTVRTGRFNPIRHYTFLISSDGDEYVFINDADLSDKIIAKNLPLTVWQGHA